MSQRDVKQRIASVGNIKKITRAMEMVAAARLRKAEERISELRPYAEALGDMTRQAAAAASTAEQRAFPLLQGRDEVKTVALLLVTGDRGLAGAFNSQIVRAGVKLAREYEDQGKKVTIFAAGRRGVSAMTFRGRTPELTFTGLLRQPGYINARDIASALSASYLDGQVDQVEVVYKPLRLGPHAERRAVHAAAAAGRPGRGGARGAVGSGRQRGRAGARRVRARAAGDPGAPDPRLRRDLALPGTARIGCLRARRTHDRHAQRIRECR